MNVGDLDAAAALVRYSTASARYVLGTQMRDPRLDRIRRAVVDAGLDGLTRTEVSGLFSRNLAATILSELLAELLADQGFEVVSVESGGRPTQLYRCRP